MKPIREITRDAIEHQLRAAGKMSEVDVAAIVRALAEHEQVAVASDPQLDKLTDALERELRSSAWATQRIAPIVGALRSFGQLSRRVAELEAARMSDATLAVKHDYAAGKSVDDLKDRFVALHQEWFGVPGALTPELVRQERDAHDKVVAELAAERTKVADLVDRIAAVRNTSISRLEAEVDLERAAEEFDAALVAASDAIDRIGGADGG